MKYEAEINKVLEEALRDEWMDDEDWNFIRTAMGKHPDWNLEKMERDIDVGIQNGYSLEYQLTLCGEILRKLKAAEL